VQHAPHCPLVPIPADFESGYTPESKPHTANVRKSPTFGDWFFLQADSHERYSSYGMHNIDKFVPYPKNSGTCCTYRRHMPTSKRNSGYPTFGLGLERAFIPKGKELPSSIEQRRWPANLSQTPQSPTTPMKHNNPWQQISVQY